MTRSISLREGSSQDFPVLAQIDGSMANDWVLYIERIGGPDELDFRLRWQRTKEAGSVRRPQIDAEELQTEWKRSDRLIVAELNDRPVGYVMLGENWNRTAEVTLIGVDRSHRRRGIGQQLIREAETYAHERRLRAVQWELQNDNRDAIDFALAQGFRIAGFHEALYRNDDLGRQEAANFMGIAVYLTKPVTVA